MGERLFAVDGRTDRERAATRAVQVAAQGALFDMPADSVEPSCPVCGGAHSVCPFGVADTLGV